MDGASLPGREKWRPALFGAASYRGTEAARGSQIFIGLLCQVETKKKMASMDTERAVNAVKSELATVKAGCH